MAPLEALSELAVRNEVERECHERFRICLDAQLLQLGYDSRPVRASMIAREVGVPKRHLRRPLKLRKLIGPNSDRGSTGWTDGEHTLCELGERSQQNVDRSDSVRLKLGRVQPSRNLVNVEDGGHSPD
ncbi:MAG: hypothetical protein ACXVHL_32925 [Solirubrobacteraceae bacterium]